MALRYDFFDEAYYLQNNPDVDANVNAPGGFFSGIEHFDRFGRFERRVFVSPFYNEDSYLAKYPDVAAAVSAGAFSSGLQHFTEIGYDEGRSPDIGIPNGGEFYLRKYPDVAAAVGAGVYRSWYDHFISAGRFEGRSPTYFDEQAYLIYNPDVTQSVRNGVFTSGFDHFVRFGQFEDRIPIFSGTSGNDVVTGFGINRTLFGVAIETTSGDPYNYTLRSAGVGEIDTLIGSVGKENFALASEITPSNPTSTQFYVGQGAGDYALIRGFERGIDTIELAGPIGNYSQEAAGGNLSIFTRTPTRDLVAVIEGVTTPLTLTSGEDFDPSPGTSFLT